MRVKFRLHSIARFRGVLKQQDVAIKLVSQPEEDRELAPMLENQFTSQVVLLFRLQHPNIVTMQIDGVNIRAMEEEIQLNLICTYAKMLQTSAEYCKQEGEEEAEARKAKEEEATTLEFEKWKGEFSVDAEGTTENEVQDGTQGLLFDFVEYIKKQKCVQLEDLAAEFKLRTQDCINRITSLEDMDMMRRLSGVMDDRGKYIYISHEEMQSVAEYIKREGRVNIAHLASQSNRFIDFEPKSQPVEDFGIAADEIAVA